MTGSPAKVDEKLGGEFNFQADERIFQITKISSTP
jgi:hypothetical protein